MPGDQGGIGKLQNKNDVLLYQNPAGLLEALPVAGTNKRDKALENKSQDLVKRLVAMRRKYPALNLPDLTKIPEFNVIKRDFFFILEENYANLGAVPADKRDHHNVSKVIAGAINAMIGKQASNVGPIASLFLGLFKEFMDLRYPARHDASIGDVVADLSGIIKFLNLAIKFNSIEINPFVGANTLGVTIGAEF